MVGSLSVEGNGKPNNSNELDQSRIPNKKDYGYFEMTDQSKPNTDVPDVIYARLLVSSWRRKVEDFTLTGPEYTEVTFIRADL